MFPYRRCWQLLLLAAAVSGFLRAQLTTGIVEGILRNPDGRTRGGVRLNVRGTPGFRLALETCAGGEFAVVLPYGEYQFFFDAYPPGVTVSV